MLSIEIAVAKTHKYASRDSGDTAETVERPTGGVSVILVDGQGSGQAAKTLSMMVSSKAVSLIKEGVRDGAVARGTHDFLHAYRHGRVSATLDLVSVDLATQTIVVTRNSGVPYLVRSGGEMQQMDSTSGPIGLYRHTRPTIDQYPIEAGLIVVCYSDGIVNAGGRVQRSFDALTVTRDRLTSDALAHDLVDGVLAAAIAADDGRPNDDMTVAAVTIVDAPDRQPLRTLRVSVPFGM
ncbi:MAG: PP2C family protein-serine/threonine phosphatase [Vicinamibacterales bacterium]